MLPNEYFNKKIIGKLSTREISKANLRDSYTDPYVPFKMESKEYDIIDKDLDMYIVNSWYNETNKEVLLIHKTIVKEVILYK